MILSSLVTGTFLLFVLIICLILCVIKRMRGAKKINEDHNQQPVYEEVMKIQIEENAAYGYIICATKLHQPYFI